MASSDQINDIMTYWFGNLKTRDDVDKSKNKLWWMGGEDIDAEIKQRFGKLVSQALDGKLQRWMETPRGCLALVILLDQFTRNVGRGSAEAYVGDAAALDVCLAAMEKEYDRELRFVERSFLYMPMMHAEDRAIAKRSREMFAALSDEIKAQSKEGYPDSHSHAVQHADIVLRFGRYPHRNEVLGRKPTAEEVEFMKAGGATFGQSKKSC